MKCSPSFLTVLLLVALNGACQGEDPHTMRLARPKTQEHADATVGGSSLGGSSLEKELGAAKDKDQDNKDQDNKDQDNKDQDKDQDTEPGKEQAQDKDKDKADDAEQKPDMGEQAPSMEPQGPHVTPSEPPGENPPPKEGRPPLVVDWMGVMGTGQSLSVGGCAEIPTAKAMTPHYKNLQLVDSTGIYNVAAPEAVSLGVGPLKELIRPTPAAGDPQAGAYPKNIYGETPHTALAEQMSSLAEAAGKKDFTSVHSVVGHSGQPMTFLATPTNPPYLGMLFEVRALTQLAKKANKSFAYGGITLTHGEADGSNPDYEAALMTYADILNKEIKGITAQKNDIPMFLSQQNSVPTWRRQNGKLIPPGFAYSTQAQWLASVHAPHLVIMSGPKYQYQYVDGVHMDAKNYELVGEKLAQAMFVTLVKGEVWRPLQPRTVQWSPNTTTIAIDFDVPFPPLAWDERLQVHQTANVAWKNGRGFEVLNADGQALTIDGVDLAASSVKIRLASPPGPGPLTVQYAMTQDGTDVDKAYGGQELGRRGQLKDSDPFVGYMTGVAQPNYCVAFSVRTGFDRTQVLTPQVSVDIPQSNLVSNQGSTDQGPFKLRAGQTLTLTVTSPNMAQTVTAEIWDIFKTAAHCKTVGKGQASCTWKAPDTLSGFSYVFTRQYFNDAGVPYSVRIQISLPASPSP